MSKQPIVVKIKAAVCEHWDRTNPLHGTALCMKTMRDAGIPVIGDIALRGVSSGSLAMSTVFEEGQKVYRYIWTPGEDDDEL